MRRGPCDIPSERGEGRTTFYLRAAMVERRREVKILPIAIVGTSRDWGGVLLCVFNCIYVVVFLSISLPFSLLVCKEFSVLSFPSRGKNSFIIQLHNSKINYKPRINPLR